MTVTAPSGIGDIVQAFCGCVGKVIDVGHALDRSGGRLPYLAMQVTTPHTGYAAEHNEQVAAGVIARFDPVQIDGDAELRLL